MYLDTNEQGQIRLTAIFEPIELVSPSGESIVICMRDGGFEIALREAVDHPHYSIRGGLISITIDYKASVDILCALIEKVRDDPNFGLLSSETQKQAIDVGVLENKWLGR